MLICLIGFITISDAQIRRNDGHNRPNMSINNKGESSQHRSRTRSRFNAIHPKPKSHSPIVYRHRNPIGHIPINNMPYKIRRFLHRHYKECVVVDYIGVCNPGYLPGHDMYYEVHLSNGIILLFSTKYKIIH